MRAAGRAESGPASVLDAVYAFMDGGAGGKPIVVAFSGGLDSCVLLHALRFGWTRNGSGGANVIAAHFDHGMRGTSSADADWAAGVCRAWGLPVIRERAAEPPGSEADARTARYAFLERVTKGAGVGAMLTTAHHADDQAETVLFRMLRGTGPDGLRGIHARRAGLARPLLNVWREDLEAYAARTGLRWREDPTNEHLGYARNVLRHEVLPVVEQSVAPGARRALVRLARLADADASAWAEALSLLLPVLNDVVDGPVGDGPAIDRSVWRREVGRDAFVSLGSALRARVIRYLASELGASLDEAAVRRVDDFVASSTSGRSIELGNRVVVALELDRVVFFVPDPARSPKTASVDEPVVIESGTAGRGTACLSGRRIRVAWSEEEGEPRDGNGEGEAWFDRDRLSFPLEVRARIPGDRLRQKGGSRKVKKILLEHRIPSADRDVLPVLADAAGEVLWIPGVARSTVAAPQAAKPSLRITIEP